MRSAEYAVQTRALRKTYRTRHGKQVAVESLDLEVPRGGVHGFLGPNGSGKTTTIRMLLGLAAADSGEMRIFDTVVPKGLPRVINQIGAIVESPKFFGPFSGRLNLQLAADAIGVPRSEVDRVLEEVGLSDRGRDNFQTYSLGMKQRLAVACTLLKDPDLLIFDEPTNGLDPSGIHEIRETIRGLGMRGKTVLVSSHILAEVQQMADTVSIVAKGRLLAAGSIAELVGQSSNTVTVGLADPSLGLQVLQQAGYRTQLVGNKLLVEDVEDASLVSKTLAFNGLYVSSLVALEPNLESTFLSITQGMQVQDPPDEFVPQQLVAKRGAQS